MSYDELQTLVREAIPCTAREYPELLGMKEQERQLFVVRHLLEHQIKSAGKLAAEIERTEHGGLMHDEQLAEITRNFFINAFKMADILGFSTEKISSMIRSWAEEEQKRYA